MCNSFSTKKRDDKRKSLLIASALVSCSISTAAFAEEECAVKIDDNSPAIQSNTCPAGAYSVGHKAHGGIVIYVEAPDAQGCGAHGLVGATRDASNLNGVSQFAWAPVGAGAALVKAESLCNGLTNVTAIQQAYASQSGDYASKIAASYGALENGEKCDAQQLCIQEGWYLPSKAELALFQRDYLGPYKPSGTYWSSTEANDIEAWIVTFGDFESFDFAKDKPIHKVRAVRKF